MRDQAQGKTTKFVFFFYLGLSYLHKLIWQWLEKLTDDKLIWKCIRKSKKRNQSDSPVRDQIVLQRVLDVILVGYLQSPADHTHYYPMPTKFHPLLVPNYGMHLQQWPSLSQGLARVLVYICACWKNTMVNNRIKEKIKEQTKKKRFQHKAPYISPGGHGCPHVQTWPSWVKTTECVPPAAT